MHREKRVDDLRMDGTAPYIERKTLLDQAVSVLGDGERAILNALTDRQVREKVLIHVAPSFEIEGRSDDAISAAFDWLMRERAKPAPSQPSQASQPASQQRADGLYDQQRIDGELIELERARLDAWRRKAPSQTAPRAGLDVDAQLRALESKRQNAWRKPPAA